MSIARKAYEIVHERSEEKERQYGDFHETMARATRLFNEMTNRSGEERICVEDLYMAMIAMKFARQAYAHKEDNLLDAIAYMDSLNEWIKKF